MKYMGSKNRIAKYLLPLILKDRKNRWYVEPFVGGGNIIDKVKDNRIGSDINKYIICLFQGLQNNFIPPNFITEEQYQYAKNNRILTPLVSFIGFNCSYAGKWFGGYARGKNNKGIERNYCLESKNNLLKQLPNIKNVTFINCNYKELYIPLNSIIYCDPPYKNTTGYKDGGFKYQEFWEWCRLKINEGHQVFISEYEAPSDFKCIWKREVYNSLTKNTGDKIGVEKLFTK